MTSTRSGSLKKSLNQRYLGLTRARSLTKSLIQTTERRLATSGNYKYLPTYTQPTKQSPLRGLILLLNSSKSAPAHYKLRFAAAHRRICF